jgi:hypothetical protein
MLAWLVVRHVLEPEHGEHRGVVPAIASSKATWAFSCVSTPYRPTASSGRWIGIKA